MTDLPPPWTAFSIAFEGLSLPENFFPKIESYLHSLALVNQSINLISFGTESELRAHVVDALQALRLFPAGDGFRVIDVGTGGGFPGVPLALARSGWVFSLLDSIKKKQTAVSSLLESVPMTNASALCGRAEELGHQEEHRGQYDFALCRAVGRLSMVLELTLPFLKVGGKAILHRGNDGAEEVGVIGKALSELGGCNRPSLSYRLPGLDKERIVICIEKTSQTSTKYPRRVGIPEKRPL